MPTPPLPSTLPSPTTSARPSASPQQLHERGPRDTLILHSPYGAARNTTYGWGTLFKAPMQAVVPGYPQVHIGISSLNGVPTVGKSDRSMRTLLAAYRKKFNCLEHCYPYHRIDDAAAWRSWADMVADSNVVDARARAANLFTPSHSSSSTETTPADAEASTTTAATALPTHTVTVNASRFHFTVKANNLLTHVKQLQMQEPEVQEQVRLFFHQRCPLLEPFLGPVLVQLPPSFAYSAVNVKRLSELHAQLPHEEVLLLEETAAGMPLGSTHCAQRVRIAVEFRNRTWYRQETFDLLRSFRWALVVAHHHDDPTFSNIVDTDAGFLYLRLHGPLGRNTGDYGPLAMQMWAEDIVQYLQKPLPPPDHSTDGSPDQRRDQTGGEGRDEGSAVGAGRREVFVFLNNSDSHIGGTMSSVVDATCLAEHLQRLLPPPASAAVAHEPVDPFLATSTPPAAPASLGRSSAGEPLTAPALVLSLPTQEGCRDSDISSSQEVETPPAKRPRVSVPSGDSREDEFVID